MIAGVDVSSRVIAIALLDTETGELRETLELAIKPGGVGPTMPQAPAFRIAAETIARATHAWIEDPMGSHPRSIASGSRAVGALIASIPPWVEVTLVPPPKWKKLAGMPGNATKLTIKQHVYNLGMFPHGTVLSQDLCDAACIARACHLNSKAAT